jgi:hypothetical protein
MMKKIFGRILLAITLVSSLISILILHYVFAGTEEITAKNDRIPETVSDKGPLTDEGEADWPSWRGPSLDGKSTLTDIITDWTGGLKKLWDVKFLCQGKYSITWSAPVVRGSRLIVMGREEKKDLVFCLNANNGELIWKGSYYSEAATNHGSGPRATPFIDDTHVYTFGRSGDLACWDLLNGNLLWRKNIYEDGGEKTLYGNSSSPLVYNELIIVQGGNNSVASAYQKYTGKLIWRSEKGLDSYATPTVMRTENGDRLLILGGNNLYSLDPTGGITHWTSPWTTINDNNACTPVIEGNLIFITAFDTGCEVLKTDGNKVEIVWKNKIIDCFHSDSIILDGFIYSYSGGSSTNNGYFKCVELKTGKESWSTNKLGWGTMVYVDGHLLCMDIKGNLYLARAIPDKFQIETSFPKALGKVTSPAWTIPVIANGKLYLRYIERLICYKLK